MTTRRLAVLLLAFTAVACGDDTGDGSGGGGDGSGSGNGSGSGSGNGSGSTGAATTTSTTGGGEGGGLRAFGEPCSEDAGCESDLCFAFGMGSKCTVPCPADPADCPGTTKECNNQEPPVCKTP